MISEYIVPEQTPEILESELMSAVAVKKSAKNLEAAQISLAGGKFDLPDLKEILGNEYDPDCYIVAKVGNSSPPNDAGVFGNSDSYSCEKGCSLL